MRSLKGGRFGVGAWLALAAFALVLLLSPAQHEDLRPDSVPGHCHACTATPVASLAVEVTQGLQADLPPAGRVTLPGLRPALSTAARATADRAPPEQL